MGYKFSCSKCKENVPGSCSIDFGDTSGIYSRIFATCAKCEVEESYQNLKHLIHDNDVINKTSEKIMNQIMKDLYRSYNE